MTFCYAPWTNIDIGPNGLIKPCCKFTPNNSPINVYNSSLKEYTDSKFLQDLKNDFLSGVKPSSCQRCWAEEDNNIKSKRLLDLDRWGAEFKSYDLDNTNPLTISLGMGNICNLKCRVCSSNASSKWIKEEEFYTGTKGKIHDFYKDGSFLSQIKDVLHDIIHIDFPGGEPLVTGTTEQLEILDTIINSKRASEVSLHYTTNLTIFPNSKFQERWKHFKNVDLQFSIDGTHKHFEYNRHPANWDECYANLKKYQAIKDSNIQISIAHTLSAFTIFYLPEFYDWCNNEGLPEPWIGRLNKPMHYQPGIFPAHTKQQVKDKLSAHASASLWANEVFIHDASEKLQDFWNWTDKVDNYREESFSETFPELAELLCLSS